MTNVHNIENVIIRNAFTEIATKPQYKELAANLVEYGSGVRCTNKDLVYMNKSDELSSFHSHTCFHRIDVPKNIGITDVNKMIELLKMLVTKK